jgi:ribosomal protein S18 acetylase RimI-like enzyme
MFELRRATPSDLDFLVKIDLKEEGITSVPPSLLSDQESADHRAKILAYVTHADKAAWVFEESATGRRVGALLCQFHDRRQDEPTEANEFLFRFIDDRWVPPDGRFCEVFNLWVDPGVRRQRLATRLKQEMEVEARRRGIRLLYTHTEERNQHVIELNHKLGYREIRRGPIWNSIIRVSLVKTLESGPCEP